MASCGDSRAPAAPTPAARPASVAIETFAVRGIVPSGFTRAEAPAGAFLYRASLTLREIGGGGAMLGGVTITLTDTSGATAIHQVAAEQVFGTTRLAANGEVMTDAITGTARPRIVARMAVRVSFTGDAGGSGEVEASTALPLDLTGTWVSGAFPVRLPGDWSSARLSLVQEGDRLTGSLTSRDGMRHPVAGGYDADGVPSLSVQGLPGDSTCAAISFRFLEFDFQRDRLERLSGRASGRCFGTVAGAFELQRES